ncbi:unnamed protein product [Soboliphyme baturini]|uniref:Protein SPT2 homolog n=1 Tax=Soboliphyme baturini TaxID=241478 RepID=A0A183IXI3_9BILA|nr:unnamed protein product [Soboliphyme baturini]
MELDFQALMQQANENRLRSSYTVKALTEEAKNEARKRACKVNSNAVKTFLERKKRQEQLNLDRKIHEREQRLEERLRNSDRAACKVKEKSEAVRTTPHPAKDKGEKAKAQSSFSPSWPSRSRDLSLNSSSRPSDPVTTPKAVDVGKPRSLKKRKALPMSYTKYPNVPTASKLMRIDGRSADKRSTSELSLRELELRREFIRKYRQMCGAEPVEDESDDSYDSEMDDFIDDTPIGEEDEEFISNQIKMTLGYDRSKYKYVDDSDDLCMESNFKQICKEEARSAKLALLEDLNEYQKEQKMRRKISSRK